MAVMLIKDKDLDFLNERTTRISYLDDKENWINLNFDDAHGFAEIWKCTQIVPEREFKRIKLRAGVLGSPVQATLSSSWLQAQSSGMQHHSCLLI